MTILRSVHKQHLNTSSVPSLGLVLRLFEPQVSYTHAGIGSDAGLLSATVLSKYYHLCVCAVQVKAWLTLWHLQSELCWFDVSSVVTGDSIQTRATHNSSTSARSRLIVDWLVWPVGGAGAWGYWRVVTGNKWRWGLIKLIEQFHITFIDYSLVSTCINVMISCFKVRL